MDQTFPGRQSQYLLFVSEILHRLLFTSVTIPEEIKREKVRNRTT